MCVGWVRAMCIVHVHGTVHVHGRCVIRGSRGRGLLTTYYVLLATCYLLLATCYLLLTRCVIRGSRGFGLRCADHSLGVYTDLEIRDCKHSAVGISR